VAAVSYLYLNSDGVTFPHFITPERAPYPLWCGPNGGRPQETDHCQHLLSACSVSDHKLAWQQTMLAISPT